MIIITIFPKQDSILNSYTHKMEVTVSEHETRSFVGFILFLEKSNDVIFYTLSSEDYIIDRDWETVTSILCV